MLSPVGDAERATLQEILGYLNFSSGASDPAFLGRLNELWRLMEGRGVRREDFSAVAEQWLNDRLKELAGESSAFKDSEQARHAVRLIFDEVLPAYRRHHHDLLFHQSDGDLW